MKVHVSVLGLLIALGASAQSPEQFLRRPLPREWMAAPEFQQTLPSDDPWWATFGDATLDTLITLGIDNNLDVSQAMRRREMARQAVTSARAGYYPTVGVTAGYDRARTGGVTASNFQLGADMNWEIDLFGRITQQVRQSKAQLRVRHAQWVGAMVSMAAEIATYYVDLRVVQQQIEVVNDHIANQERVVQIAEARHSAGLVSKLDVTQALTLLYTTRASLPALQARAAQTVNSLAILLGVYSPELAELVRPGGPLPSGAPLPAIGVPANIMRRRPDIAEAEAQLAAYAAQAGMARSEFLPALSITGSIGWAGTDLRRTFNREHLTFAVGPKLTWTVFDGLGRKAALASAREQLEAGIDAYNLAVVTAYAEVENAMLSYQSAQATLELYVKEMEQARESVDLALRQYKDGLTAFSNVIDAQTDWLNSANALVGERGNALIALIDLYKALGGAPTDQ